MDSESAEEKTNQESKKRPFVRLNSSKVTPLKKDSLVVAENRSKFSEWRAKRERDKSGSRARELNNLQPKLDSSSSRIGTKERKSSLKKWLTFLAGFLVLALIFIGVVFYSPLLATQKITVEGASLMNESTIQDQLSSLEGVPLTRIDEQDVRDLIGQSSVLRDVKVEAHPPHELVVKLNERVPVAVVKNDSTFVMADAEGTQLGEVKSVDESSVPLVDGGTEILGTPEYKTISEVLAALPADLLSEVKEAKAESASTITLVMNDNTEVVWGTAEKSELKAKVLTQMRQSVGGERAVSTYDVSSPMVPTVK